MREQAAETFKGSGVVALGESIDEYNDSIDSAVQEDTEQDRTDAVRAKDTLSQLSKLADIGDDRKKLEELISGWIPTFIYMDDHKPFPR